MAVSNVNSASGADLIAQLNGTSTAATSSTNELQDRFMAVLLAQLKNQDPLNPMDNAEMTSQLAQISTVEGITKLNTSMTGIAEVFSSGQLLQAAGLVGRQVMAEGDALDLSGGEAQAGVKLDGATDQLSINIFNAQGSQVGTLELGKQAAGFVPFTWNGQDSGGNALPDGDYNYTVTATRSGTAVEATRYGMDAVSSVASGASGISVQLQTGATIGLSQIQTIY